MSSNHVLLLYVGKLETGVTSHKKVGLTCSRRRDVEGVEVRSVEGAEPRRRRHRWGEEWGGGSPPPLPNRLGGQVEGRELPQQGPGQSPSRKRISVLFKRHRMPLVEIVVLN